MLKNKLFILFGLALLIFAHKSYSQSDSFNYKFGIGLSALDFWDNGFEAYDHILKSNIAGDPFESRTLFINNFSLGFQVMDNNKFGRITYLVTNNWNRSKRISMLSLSYGTTKQYLNGIIVLGVEGGIGYGLVFDNENQTFTKNLFGILGGSLDIPIWEGIYLQNQVNTLFSGATKKFYLNHTLSIAYKF